MASRECDLKVLFVRWKSKQASRPPDIMKSGKAEKIVM
jgi:hypothetical protein